MTISMSDGTYVRQHADDPLTMVLLSQRHFATAELFLTAMEDSLDDGTSKSGNDTSYTRPAVIELPSARSSGSERVLHPINATTSSDATMLGGTPMTEERFSEMYGLVLMKCAHHPMHISPTCQICASYESEKKRINDTYHELIKQACGTHRAAVSPTCPTCILWAAHCNDLKGEKSIDCSVTEPDHKDLCRFLTDQVSFERVR